MQVQRRIAVASAVAIGAAGALAGVPSVSLAAEDATASNRGVRVVAEGLNAPFGLKKAVNHRGLIVAEAASGQVTRVFLDGRKQTILTGVPGVAGVAGGPRRVFAVIGGDPTSGGEFGPTRLLRMNYQGGRAKVIANLLQYELRNNPDGQVQFDEDGNPVDALSNPFALEWSRFGLFVADGGANDVLKVNPRTGRVRTFFAPRTFRDTPECQNAPNNPGTKGCDPVPTGVDVRGHSVYVSFLGAHAPGAGRLYKLHARTGEVQRIWKGFTAPTGVAVRNNGTTYLSHVEEGAPPGAPAPSDPSTVGEITRIKAGKRTHAQVTMPTGLALHNGRLFSTTWSLAAFPPLQIPDAGQVVRVRAHAFE